MTLPGGFVLPIALCVDTYVPAEVEPNAFTAEEASLRQFAKQYLTEQMVAGNILESKESISTEACQVLRGSYLCTEMIGRRQPEKMGE